MIHQFGKDYAHKPIALFSERYTVPWFYQNYKLFAPDPPRYFNTFLYRYESDTGWSSWIDPGQPYLKGHWHNRLSNNADMYAQFHGLADDLFNDIQTVHFNPEAVDEDWLRMPGYLNARRYMNEFVVEKQPSRINRFQCGVETTYLTLDESGNVPRSELFQTYPIDRFDQVNND